MPELLLCLQKYENRYYTHIMEKLSQLELYIYPFSVLYNTHNKRGNRNGKLSHAAKSESLKAYRK